MRKLTIAVLLLSAPPAAADEVPVPPEITRVAAVPVTCSGKLDCDQKWAKALKWVLDTSSFKIQIANDMLIQTYGPNGGLHATAFTITKTPTGPDAYTFDWQASCTSQPFCGLPVTMYRFTFVTTVMGAEMAKSLGPTPAN